MIETLGLPSVDLSWCRDNLGKQEQRPKMLGKVTISFSSSFSFPTTWRLLDALQYKYTPVQQLKNTILCFWDFLDNRYPLIGVTCHATCSILKSYHMLWKGVFYVLDKNMYYRVSHLKGALLWSCVQGRVFNTFCRYISQIKAKGCANRLVESHLWWCHFWRENSNVCYNSALQTVKIQMRHFLVNLIVKGVPG